MPVATALIGGLIGHRLSETRERLTRRRQLQDSLHAAWFHERQQLKRGLPAPGAGALEIAQYTRALGPFQRHRFLRSLQHYKAAKQRTQHNELREPTYADPGEVGRRLDRLLQLTAR